MMKVQIILEQKNDSWLESVGIEPEIVQILEDGFVNATDINSSLGRTIYSYRGVFSNTDNWSLLSTDPTINTLASTFIN